MARKEIDLKKVFEKIEGFLNTLTPEQRQIVESHTTVRKLKKNEVIYNEGETPQKLWCLVSGKVKIYRDGVGGRSQIMRVLNSVEYFGYRAYIAHEPFVTGAAAFEPSMIAEIPIGIITNIMTTNAKLAYFFVERLAKDLGTSDERTVNLTQKHIRGRLAENILFLKESYGLEEDGSTLSIYLSREDLANLSNMTTANAIRTLSAFAHEKLVAIDGRKIKIMDESGLQKISKLG